MLLGEGYIYLLEGLEELIHVLLFYPYPSINDTNLQLIIPYNSGSNLYTPLVGELDGVVHQVYQDLLYPPPIAGECNALRLFINLTNDKLKIL